MFVTVRTETYVVDFSHERLAVPQPHVRESGEETSITARTYCLINKVHLIDGQGITRRYGRLEAVAAGLARCSRLDQFCRETGRRLALKRAVAHIDDRETRGAILKAYFTRHRRGEN